MVLNLFLPGAFLSGLSGKSLILALALDGLFTTQGIMVILLVAYAAAMWMFLTSAPKVHTIMVSDLKIAQEIYEGLLNLPVADVPLHYYYNYEQTLGAGLTDPLYFSNTLSSPGRSLNDFSSRPDRLQTQEEGLWYQLKKNTQLHVIAGAGLGPKDRQRHVCFDRECLESLLLRIQSRGIKHKIRRERPLNFLLKDWQGRIIELSEVSN